MATCYSQTSTREMNGTSNRGRSGCAFCARRSVVGSNIRLAAPLLTLTPWWFGMCWWPRERRVRHLLSGSSLVSSACSLACWRFPPSHLCCSPEREACSLAVRRPAREREALHERGDPYRHLSVAVKRDVEMSLARCALKDRKRFRAQRSPESRNGKTWWEVPLPEQGVLTPLSARRSDKNFLLSDFSHVFGLWAV